MAREDFFDLGRSFPDVSGDMKAMSGPTVHAGEDCPPGYFISIKIMAPRVIGL